MLMKARARIIFIIGILFVLLIIFSAAAIVYTERPKFCITCHIMDPYYASWEKSAHNEVNCIECHYEPGLKAHVKGKIVGLVQVAQYLTGRYSEKPAAKVSDLSCLRGGCHTKADIKSKVVPFKDMLDFSHSVHLNDICPDIELRCTSCHTQSTNEEHIIVDKNTCYICHFKAQVGSDKAKISLAEDASSNQQVELCQKCHSITTSIGDHKEYVETGMVCSECHGDLKSGDGGVSKQDCLFCHAEEDKIEKIKDSQLLHKIHIPENRAICINCHGLIEHP